MRALRYLWTSKLGAEIEVGKITGRDLYRMFRRELSYEGSYDEFKALWCDHFTLDSATAELLAAVARRLPVYLLSNTNHLHYEHIRTRYAFARQARGAVLSHRVKARKPDPAIYRAALKRAKVAAQEAVFIDDLPENVAAAAKLGIKALRFTDAETLARELKSLGLLS